MSQSTIIKDKQGSFLTRETDRQTDRQREREQEERLAEHFREILNRPRPEEDVDISEAADDLDINTVLLRKEEIIEAIKSLENCKVPGHDNLNTELFKADPELAATTLQPLFAALWEGEEVPADWAKGVIIMIPETGAFSDCNNWRSITLLSAPTKILAKLIIKRISDAVDAGMRKEQTGFRKEQAGFRKEQAGFRKEQAGFRKEQAGFRKEQAGFRKERGCTDQIFSKRNTTEQCTEWLRQLYINFVDYENTFDGINRDSLWRILTAYGIPLQTPVLSIP